MPLIKQLKDRLTMKTIISKVRIFIACACFFVGTSVFAEMEIVNYELTGQIPGTVCGGADAWWTSGQYQVMAHVREDNNGGMHYSFREQVKGGEIMDANGNTYRVSGNWHLFTPTYISRQDNSGGTTIIHDSWNFRYTPTKGGDGEMFNLKGRLQVVIDSDGNVNVIKSQIVRECN
jgi:hypothetical protein